MLAHPGDEPAPTRRRSGCHSGQPGQRGDPPEERLRPPPHPRAPGVGGPELRTQEEHEAEQRDDGCPPDVDAEVAPERVLLAELVAAPPVVHAEPVRQGDQADEDDGDDEDEHLRAGSPRPDPEPQPPSAAVEPPHHATGRTMQVKMCRHWQMSTSRVADHCSNGSMWAPGCES